MKIKTTSNKLWLFVACMLGMVFAIVWVTALYKGIYYGTVIWPIVYDGFQSWELEWPLPILIIWFPLLTFVLFVFVFLGTWLSVLIVCIKWWINLFKRQNIKRNKEWMRKIDAKVVSFKLCWEVNKNGQHTSSIYYFTASDWSEKYDSEEFNAIVTWRCWDIRETLELMKIHYSPQNKENTIKALNERLQTIAIGLQETSWIKETLLRWAYAATQQVKENIESGMVSYMEFKWHKLFIGDKVEVYIDPNNPKKYWIDTNFLYS